MRPFADPAAVPSVLGTQPYPGGTHICLVGHNMPPLQLSMTSLEWALASSLLPLFWFLEREFVLLLVLEDQLGGVFHELRPWLPSRLVYLGEALPRDLVPLDSELVVVVGQPVDLVDLLAP